MEKMKIAIIGLGPAGLTALKCLREEGFDAVALERRSEVGGVWSYSADGSYTSVIGETVSNISKFVMAAYMQSYAQNFNLEPYMHFNTTVTHVKRNPSNTAWTITFTLPSGTPQSLHFDKVVFSTGSERLPLWPSLPGHQTFTGQILHGQSYRCPEAFAGRRVLVVGMGNTACDVSLSLTRHASHVYQSYRRGRTVLSRYLDNGLPTDTLMTWPLLRLKYFLDAKIPSLSRLVVDTLVKRKMVSDAARQETSKSKASARRRLQTWRLLDGPSLSHTHPAVQEDFLSALYDESVVPVSGFRAFVGADAVLLEDGTVIRADAVIFCTGYSNGFSIMPELEMDGACRLPPQTALDAETDQSTSSQPHLPRLYQMMFPPKHASSIAFLSWMAPQQSVWTVAELASTALSQIWASQTTPPTPNTRPATLPPEAKMEAWVDGYHSWWRSQHAREPSMRSGLQSQLPSLPSSSPLLFAAKTAKKLTFSQLATLLHRSEVATAAIFYGQARASEEDISALAHALDIPRAQLVEALPEFPDRGRSVEMPPRDPLIYRLFEVVQNYGYAYKAVLNEKFGDGIMSGVCFSTDVQKETDKDGADWAVITMKGKWCVLSFYRPVDGEPLKLMVVVVEAAFFEVLILLQQPEWSAYLTHRS
ncbi:hypothetical protein CDD80_1265 [Ophiocordyceps camponoti-rufipedis]|uniref:Cyanate lyase C-terminal domain-containing protein n=1 Tax=Ophiocordyceps camponoti-rufipedis TaxID=2004952 RepID=A0A2C5YQW2_9HYPO|nr:hypothetical protein CDD80_1265 [Ophiocordyceps camponoti-rufipedis]